MSPITKRRLIDFAVTVVTMAILIGAGAGFWSSVIIPYAIWNYYDGQTRASLPGGKDESL